MKTPQVAPLAGMTPLGLKSSATPTPSYQPAPGAILMPLDAARKLKVGQKVKVLVGGCGHVCEDDGEIEREFAAGEIVTVEQLDDYASSQGFSVTVCASNGVVNVFDAADFGGLYPFLVIDSLLLHAAHNDSVDAAAKMLQDAIGITDGGLASIHLPAPAHWAKLTPATRLAYLSDWLRGEALQLIEQVDGRQ